ncbi:MAG: DNA polymerase III subunit beta [Bacteroidetes bacterium 4572_77]|nr:MAG: DNA polymerase III subunit beta [Bacteroidetes bacterium 4572_77]
MALPIVPPRATIDILEYINLILDEDNQLRIVATDQEMMILAKLDVENTENGAVLVPAKRLNDICSALPITGKIEFEVDESSYNINIHTEKGGSYSLKGLNPDQYLDLPELFENENPLEAAENAVDGTIDTSFKSIKFAKNELSYLCSKTLISISKEDYRPQMTGMFLEFKGDYVNAVSTDSYRLTKAVLKSKTAEYPDDLSVIIPAKSVEYLKKRDSETTMSFISKGGEITHVKFAYDNLIFISNIIKDKFPPYESVIPSDNNITLDVNRDEMLANLGPVLLCANSRSQQVILSMTSDRLTIKSEDQEFETKGEEMINCECNHAPLEVCLNGTYLKDSLSNLDQAPNGEDNMVTFTFNDPDRAVLLFPKVEEEERSLLMLLMPVRLGNR